MCVIGGEQVEGSEKVVEQNYLSKTKTYVDAASEIRAPDGLRLFNVSTIRRKMKYISLLAGLLTFVTASSTKPRIDTVVCVFTASPEIPYKCRSF